MKYEDIKVGDVFTYLGEKETVIYKNGKYRFITTINYDEIPTTWSENELDDLKPIKEELPEEGLLVGKSGSLVYKLSDGSAYGFGLGKQSNYFFNKLWVFHIDGHWRKATDQEKYKFIEMLEKECEGRGLLKDTKIEKHADGTVDELNINYFYSGADATEILNKNGQIFYKGNFATPIKEKSAKELVVDLNNYTTETTESGVIILTPLKKQYE